MAQKSLKCLHSGPLGERSAHRREGLQCTEGERLLTPGRLEAAGSAGSHTPSPEVSLAQISRSAPAQAPSLHLVAQGAAW